jgi:hypothetical protein
MPVHRYVSQMHAHGRHLLGEWLHLIHFAMHVHWNALQPHFGNGRTVRDGVLSSAR